MNQLTGSPQESAKSCTKCRKAKASSQFHRFGKDRSRIGKWCEECYQKHGTGKGDPRESEAR